MKKALPATRLGENGEKITERRSRSLANLRPPWKPGQSGNPAGRPAGGYLSRFLRPYPVNQDGQTFAEVIAERLVEAAVMGDTAAARELANRAEGKVLRLLFVK